MKLFKKLGTYFSMLALILSGTSLKTFSQEEGAKGPAEAFDDSDTDEVAEEVLRSFND